MLTLFGQILNSGLDASSASLVMSSLSSLSKDDNVTVVAVIHQVSFDLNPLN